MSRLAQFHKKSETLEFEVENEDGKKIKEKIIVKPFKTTDLELMADIADMTDTEKRAKAAHAMIKKVLKDNIPDFTEEEYTKMDYAFADSILEVIMDVNSVESTAKADVKAKFLADIKARQEAAGVIKPSTKK